MLKRISMSVYVGGSYHNEETPKYSRIGDSSTCTLIPISLNLPFTQVGVIRASTAFNSCLRNEISSSINLCIFRLTYDLFCAPDEFDHLELFISILPCMQALLMIPSLHCCSLQAWCLITREGRDLN